MKSIPDPKQEIEEPVEEVVEDSSSDSENKKDGIVSKLRTYLNDDALFSAIPDLNI